MFQREVTIAISLKAMYHSNMRIPSIVSPAPDTIVIPTVQPELFIILYTYPSFYELIAYSSSPLVIAPYAIGSIT